MSGPRERCVYLRQQAVERGDIVQRQTAEDEVERRGWKYYVFEVRARVPNCGVVRIGGRAREHLFGDVDTEHRCGAVRARPAAEPAETAAEVEHARTVHVGQQRLQRGPLGGRIESHQRAAELTVRGEKIRVVVDVLRHTVNACAAAVGSRRHRAAVRRCALLRSILRCARRA